MNAGVYDVLSARKVPRAGRIFSGCSIRKAFDKAVGEARLEDFRFHDLRHTGGPT